MPEPRDPHSKSLANLRRRLLGDDAESRAANTASKRRVFPVNPTRRVLAFSGVMAALHFGFPGGGESEGGALDEVSESIAHVSTDLRERTGAGAEQLARAMFYTDFSEPEALANWWQLPDAALVIEPYEKRMSAVARGPSLAKPTRNMTDGQVFFRFIQATREAGFILRGQDERDCYRLVCTRAPKGKMPELVLSMKRRRQGEESEIARAVVGDLDIAGLAQVTVSVQMDGADFAARVHYKEPSRWFTFLGPAQRERVVATWRDTTFRDGAVGVWGPADKTLEATGKAGQDKFRVLEVTAET